MDKMDTTMAKIGTYYKVEPKPH